MFLSDIGEGSNALFCLTDRTQCCTPEAGDARSGWEFPEVDSNLNFYRTRGISSVLLNKRSDAVGPTGVFTCKISDRTSLAILSLYIGIYDDAGEGVF